VVRPEDDDSARFARELDELRAILADPAAHPPDAARESYSALLDRDGDDPARLAVLREVATELHRLEREGILPRAMVVRTRRRRE
jgi:hypothetical protein